MKIINLLILVFAFMLTGKAQIVIGTYHGNENPKRIKIPASINSVDGKSTIAKDKELVILGLVGTSYIVRSDGIEYLVDKNSIAHQLDAEKKSVIPLVGAFSFPFKYRPQSGILESNFSLSVVGGPRFCLDKEEEHHLALLLGVGQSSLTLDKDNTDPSSGITETTTRSGATFSFSILYEWSQLQLAASIGIDDNLNNKKDKWIYQSKPWLTVGIGFSIFAKN